jgi:hypothetical protein
MPQQGRPRHRGLNKDAPLSRPVTPPTAGRVIAISQVGGLHLRYERRAA